MFCYLPINVLFTPCILQKHKQMHVLISEVESIIINNSQYYQYFFSEALTLQNHIITI